MRLRSLSLQKCNKNFGTSPFASTCLRDIIPSTSEYNTSLSVWLLTLVRILISKSQDQRSFTIIYKNHEPQPLMIMIAWDWNIMSHIHSWSAMIVNVRRSQSYHPIYICRILRYENIGTWLCVLNSFNFWKS